MKKLAEEASKKREELSAASRQPGLPTINDVHVLGRSVKEAIKEAEKEEKLREGYKLSVREAESSLLKGSSPCP